MKQSSASFFFAFLLTNIYKCDKMEKKVNESEAMIRFIFILKADEVKIQESNNIKRTFRKENIEVQCYYQSVALFDAELELEDADNTCICISFQHGYFIKMTQWIEAIRTKGFTGKILLSTEALTLDLACVPKFIAAGGNYVLERSEWRKNPLALTFNKHCDYVDSWLYNQKHFHDIEILNEDALSFLFNSVLERETYPLKELSYIYDSLNKRYKKEFLESIKRKARFIGNGMFQHLKINFSGDGLITIWNNPEFCCELAVHIANNTEKKVLLIDLDRLNPTFDFYCPPRGKQNFDVDQSLEGIQRIYHKDKFNGKDYDKLCRSTIASKKLKILYGCNDLKKFEYFTNEALTEAMAFYRKRYDLVLVNVNDFIYDAYTCLSAIHSDLILVPLKNEITSMRHTQRSFELLYDKQQLDKEKVHYLFYDCKENFSNEMMLLSELLNGPIVAWISFCNKRVHHRNIKKPYSNVMSKSVFEDYKKLTRTLNL